MIFKIDIFIRNGLLPVTKECIYYMAPELIKSLGKPDFDDKFTYASDVFSFGYVLMFKFQKQYLSALIKLLIYLFDRTVWYELFCNEYPFSSNNAHSVIYLIGSGLKNISSSIQIPKEFKVNDPEAINKTIREYKVARDITNLIEIKII